MQSRFAMRCDVAFHSKRTHTHTHSSVYILYKELSVGLCINRVHFYVILDFSARPRWPCHKKIGQVFSLFVLLFCFSLFLLWFNHFGGCVIKACGANELISVNQRLFEDWVHYRRHFCRLCANMQRCACFLFNHTFLHIHVCICIHI